MIMIKIGAHLILGGISVLGSDYIKEHGTLWNVIGVSSAVKALNNAPGILIQSFKDSYVKWMGVDNDTNFEVISNDAEPNDSALNVVGE